MKFDNFLNICLFKFFPLKSVERENSSAVSILELSFCIFLLEVIHLL